MAIRVLGDVQVDRRTDRPSVIRDVTVDSLTFRVTDTGPPQGRPVLLLHGFPQTSWCWRHVIPVLAAGKHRVLALDQRGYSPGACPDAVEDYAGEQLTADVTGVLDALGIQAVDLVGHDWGAAVAWQVAGFHPDRVTTLTAISVPHPGAFMEALRSDPDQQARSAYMADFATPGYASVLLADDAAGLRSLLGDDTAVDVDHVLSTIGTHAQLRRALSWYAAQSAARALATPHTAVPTLHIWSDADPALGGYAAHATHRYVTAPFQLVTLRGVGHWIPEEAPVQTAELILAQLGRTLPGRS